MLVHKNHNKEAKYCIFALLVLVFLAAQVLHIYVFVTNGHTDSLKEIWFGYFQYFSVLSVYFSIFVCILYLSHTKHVAHTNLLLDITLGYLLCGVALFWLGQYGGGQNLENTGEKNWQYEFIADILDSIVFPILFIVFFVLIHFSLNHKNPPHISEVLIVGLIIPLCYIAYCILANFLFNPLGTGYISVYGKYSNLNYYNDDPIYGQGDMINILFYIAAFLLVFILIIFSWCFDRLIYVYQPHHHEYVQNAEKIVLIKKRISHEKKQSKATAKLFKTPVRHKIAKAMHKEKNTIKPIKSTKKTKATKPAKSIEATESAKQTNPSKETAK